VKPNILKKTEEKLKATGKEKIEKKFYTTIIV